MSDTGSNMDLEARLTMKVIRKDGTVEDVEQGWQDVPEGEKKKLLELPSFREWLNRKGDG